MPAIITITLKDTGEIEVHAPMDQKVLCYGMLEMAKFVIASFKNQPVLVKPNLVIPNFDPKGGKT